MELFCTRPGCPEPVNPCPDFENPRILRTTRDRLCACCGMPLILGDRYLPIQWLGQGGFGAAFLARDRHTPGMRPCVLKQFKPAQQLTHDQHQLAHELFMREGEVLEELGREHLQIPDLFAFFDLEVPGLQPETDEGYFYLVQEFIDGQNLEQELLARGRFEEPEVLEVLTSMVGVLGFVHAHHTIHRDIKLSNIMRNTRGRLFLLDFGAIKFATSQSQGTAWGTPIFSPGYAPPEQVIGANVSFSSDFYALAASCVELLTGLAPQQLRHPVNHRWAWRSQVAITPAFAEILDRMLQPDPIDRFQTAAEILAALRSADLLSPESLAGEGRSDFQPPLFSDRPSRMQQDFQANSRIRQPIETQMPLDYSAD